MANSLFKLLHGLYNVQTVPVCIFGNPGRGKTSTIKALGEFLGVVTEVRSSNKSDFTDFTGIPYLSDITTKSGKLKKVMKYSKPKYIRNLEKVDNGILFFDEIGTANNSIISAMLSIIQDCEFGEFSIPKTTFRVCAGNYTNVIGNHNLSIAFHNRCCNIFTKSNVEQYTQGLVSGFTNRDYAVINSEEERKAKEIQYSVAVSDFLKLNPKFLPEDIPEEIVNPTDVAYPSERSWYNAIQILSVLDNNEPDYIYELIDGTIGIEASKAFKHYLSKSDKFINLLDYVGKEQTLLLPHPNKHDEAMHIMETISSLMKQDPKRYCKLFVRSVNILHNKNKKFGDYSGYDGWIIKYLLNCIEQLDKKSLLTKDLILKFHGIIKTDDYTIDDYPKLYRLSYEGRL